jgi:phthiodiolone/phenolphthiodiolone dimycocerosates ketoreductase
MVANSVRNQRLRFGLAMSFGAPERVIGWAKHAEAAGFSFITVPDHLFHPLDDRFFPRPAWDADAMLGALAISTKVVSLGPAVTDPLRRHPATTANFVATLDRMSGGRAYLGIGAGELFNFEPLAEIDWDKPFARLREAVIVIKELWKSTKKRPANFDGKFYRLRDAYLGYKSIQQPPPPVYIGGYGPRMRSLVAEMGDGWLPWVEIPETYERMSDEITEKALRAGRKPEEIVRAVVLFTSVAGTENERAEVIRGVANVLAQRQPLLRNLGHEDLANETTDLLRAKFAGEEAEKMVSVASRIPRDTIERVMLSGTPDQILERVAQFVEAGVNTLVLVTQVEVREETVNFYSEKILPHFAPRHSR